MTINDVRGTPYYMYLLLQSWPYQCYVLFVISVLAIPILLFFYFSHGNTINMYCFVISVLFIPILCIFCYFSIGHTIIK